MSTTRCRSAYTLAEVVVSIAVVGVMLVAALNAVAAARLNMNRTTNHNRGMLLAQDLLAEILQQPYQDPDGAESLGIDDGEIAGDRSTYDDLDDYDGWSAPPQDRDGTRLPNADGWVCTVSVTLLDPETLLSVDEKGEMQQQGIELSESDLERMGWGAEDAGEGAREGLFEIAGFDGGGGAGDTGVKGITVFVSRNGVPAAEVHAIRTIFWPRPQEIDVRYIPDEEG